jgi:hypothetical protein
MNEQVPGQAGKDKPMCPNSKKNKNKNKNKNHKLTRNSAPKTDKL